MTARVLPEDHAFETTSERVVCTELAAQLGDDATIIVGQRLTDATQDYETDLLALIPGAGVVSIEVKGGQVRVDPDGRWVQQTHHGERPIKPDEQVMKAKHSLARYVYADPRWPTGRRVRWGHAIALPYTEVAPEFGTPTCPRWLIAARGDLERLGEFITDIPRRQESAALAPTPEDCDRIVEILHGRGVPLGGPSAAAGEREAQAQRLTDEQAMLLRVTRLLNRVEVRGGAGSGKTVLAMTQARQLAHGFSGQGPQRVALMCYSIGLAEYFTRAAATWPRKERPAYIGTFHDLGRSWGAPDGTRDDSDFWERRLPEQMARLAEGLTAKERFDAFVIDEAQDFADEWWRPILAALRDPETGGIYTYADENQRIFQRFGRPPVPLVPLVLDHNLRNTKQILGAFGPLAPMRMRARGGDGPEVEFVAAAAREAVEVADAQVEALLDEGWAPGDIALLTTGQRHPVQVERAGESMADYWRDFWEGEDVFYGHVLGAKGLERRAVVLCVNEAAVRDRARERLYVGLSRATDRLVIVGDPRVVAEMGGGAVARALGIG